MGNVTASLTEPPWPDVIEQPWRSERARDMDKLGGLTRGPVPRGDSLKYRQDLVESETQRGPSVPSTNGNKAAEKRPPTIPLRPRPPEAPKKNGRAQLAFGKHLIEGKAKADSGSDSDDAAAAAAVTAAATLAVVAPPSPALVAAWRRRVHRARGVAHHTVRAVLRLRGAVRKADGRGGAQRRVEDLGCFLPLALRADASAIVAHMERWQDLAGEVAAFQAELEEVTKLLPPTGAAVFGGAARTSLTAASANSGAGGAGGGLLPSTVRGSQPLGGVPASPSVGAAQQPQPPQSGSSSLVRSRSMDPRSFNNALLQPQRSEASGLGSSGSIGDSPTQQQQQQQQAYQRPRPALSRSTSTLSPAAAPLAPLKLPSLTPMEELPARPMAVAPVSPLPARVSGRLSSIIQQQPLVRAISDGNGAAAAPSCSVSFSSDTQLSSRLSSEISSSGRRVDPGAAAAVPRSDMVGALLAAALPSGGGPAGGGGAAGAPRFGGLTPSSPSVRAAGSLVNSPGLSRTFPPAPASPVSRGQPTPRSRMLLAAASASSSGPARPEPVKERMRRASVGFSPAAERRGATDGGGGGGGGARKPAASYNRARSTSEDGSLLGAAANSPATALAMLQNKHAPKIKQYAALPATPRWQALHRHVEDSSRQVRVCQKATEDLVARSNCEWAERRCWGPPEVHERPAQPSWADSEECTPHRIDLARKLRNGQLAVQLFAGEDSLTLPSGEVQDLWTADPWLLVAMYAPDKMPAGDMVTEGRSWGSRVLSQLVGAVESLAGPEAVGRLTVVLHINDQQQEQVLADIWEQPVYSQLRANMLVVVQHRASAFYRDDDDRRFREDPTTAAECPGSGYSLMQLNWRREAHGVTEDAELVVLEDSVMEILAQRKTEWIISHRVRDLGLLQPDGLLDVTMLAYTLHLAQTQRINLTMEVFKASGLVASQRYDSVCLTRLPRKTGVTVAAMAEAAEADRRMLRKSPGAMASELRHSDLGSPRMQAVLKSAIFEFYNHAVVGLARYVMTVPALAAMLDCPVTFRPKLSLSGCALRVNLDMADITCSHRARSAALTAREPAAIVRTLEDVGLLVPYLQAHDAVLRAASTSTPTHPLLVPMVKHVRKATPQSIVVLVVDRGPVSDVTVAAALAVARPGRDTVHFLSIVQLDSQREDAELLLERHRAAANTPGLTIVPLVLVREDAFLLDVLEQHLSAVSASLLVLGSHALTTCTVEAFMSSVTLACLRRFALPVLLLTKNTLVDSRRGTGEASGMRCLALVEPHARPMVHYVCGLLDPGDALRLAQVLPPAGKAVSTALASSMRSLLASFADLATGLQMTSTTTAQLEGPWERAVHVAVTAKAGPTQLLALQLPAGALKTIPHHIFSLMRTCPCPLLLYPSRSK